MSRTVARNFAGENRLGASFFFKKDEADRGSMAKFFPTIAADMIRQDPLMAGNVKDAIENDPVIFRKSMVEQFNKLILQPRILTSPSLQVEEPMIVVVDALDECDRVGDIERLLNILSRAGALQSARLRIFLTSRPELPIRLGFTRIQWSYQVSILQDIPTCVVEHDISAYFNHELAQIRDDYNALLSADQQLAGDWPCQSDVEALVKMALPLFIFAATACRFISDRRIGNPDKQLQKFLAPQGMQSVSQLGTTYLPVLRNLIIEVPTEEQGYIIQRFRNVVGSIVVLKSPLSKRALAQLLELPISDVEDALALLHSVLNIPFSPELPVSLLHLSFHDFLLDPERRAENEFWIDGKLAHQKLAANCLRLMKRLRQDICTVDDPGKSRQAVDPCKISTYLPPEVQYACLNWVHHIHGSEHDNSQQVYDFLTTHFLHWLEALGLIGRAWDSISLVRTVRAVLKVSHVVQSILS